MKETTLLFHMDSQLSVCAELGKMNSVSPHGVSKMYIFLSQSGLRTTATLFNLAQLFIAVSANRAHLHVPQFIQL